MCGERGIYEAIATGVIKVTVRYRSWVGVIPYRVRERIRTGRLGLESPARDNDDSSAFRAS